MPMQFIVLTPVVGLSWPLLTPILLTCAGALGYKAFISTKEKGEIDDKLRERLEETTNVTIRVEDLVIENLQEEVRRGESMYFEKDDIVIGVVKDERGKLRVEAMGPSSIPAARLQEEGREFAEELSQLFAQNRIVEQLEHLGAEIVEESEEEEDIVLKVRRWT